MIKTMGMKKLAAIIMIVCAGGVIKSFAQGDPGTSSVTAQYTVAVPLGNTRDVMDKLSFRGITADYRYHFNDVASVGASIGWSVFYDKEEFNEEPLSSGTTLTGTQYYYINSLPILATFNYFMDGDRVAPFGGLGIGTTFNETRIEMGLNRLDLDVWHFTLAPELGAKLNATGEVSAYITARYNISFETKYSNTQSYLGLNFGIMYKL
jgi:opacity protein-like surface antigen